MFDLIIPCLFSHFKNIKITLDSFNHIDLVNNIIIVLNNIQNNNINTDSLLEYKSKLKIIEIKDKMLPGIARQEGIKHSTSEFIVFHDADDKAHHDKLLILKYCFDNYNCDHILHFIQPTQFNFIPYQLNDNDIKIIDTKTILDFYHTTKNVNFGDIINKRISQGLSAVRKNKIIDIQWLNIKSGEDKDFNLKSLLKGNKLIMVDCFLSSYDRYKTRIMKKYHPTSWKQLQNYLI